LLLGPEVFLLLLVFCACWIRRLERPLPFLSIEQRSIWEGALLTAGEIVEQKVLNPLWTDVDGPLLLLEILGRYLTGLVSLAKELFDRVRVESEENSIEKITVGQALVLLRALRVW